MINQEMFDLGAEPNKIRELFAFGLERKAAIGAENVFDYSIGNPSVPAPDCVTQAFRDLLQMDPVVLHEYTPSPGDPQVRAAIADYLTRTFGLAATPGNVYVTSGASSAIAITLSAVCEPGDEVIVISPYFPEYRTWTHTAGCTLVEVPAQVPNFQPDVAAIEAAITERTSAIIVNSPNNPVGAVYSRESLTALCDMLARKEAELGRRIFLVADEPYREITYGAEVPYLPSLYVDTIVCYSFSKSLSLPGERIGYIYVSDRMLDAGAIFTAVCGAGRALGYICAPVMLQRAVAKCLGTPSDVEAYAANREILTRGLTELGYEFVEPEGAFYLWVRALESDAVAFSERAKDFELLLVPSDSFGATGWVRLSYCIARDTIERSMPAFKALKESYR
ncbi:pyridoxal phosphate-dependent aminotransferase [Adlercreutzia murintestinalis]|uniref:pyridoxal phosphate-dependent aminotransferase n=1 Tax=Adlercreutzia murintestinalis TaxID=2941325 RepID=UPI00203CE18D|nr:pyridoxal phosphate-dependent aminotransferase [Adlercreutzia murintestinalis]